MGLSRRRSRALGGAALLLAVAAGLAVWMTVATDQRGKRQPAQGAPPSAYRAPPGFTAGEATGEEAGAITGWVRDLAGRGLAGATVSLTRAWGPEGPDFVTVPPAMATSTGPGGQFGFAGLPPGAYGLTAFLDAGGLAVHGPVTVEAGRTARVLLVIGGSGHVLSGRVLETGGGVLPGAVVVAERRDPGGAAGAGGASSVSAPVVAPLFRTVAGADGRYRLVLAPGRYRLVGEADGYARGEDVLRVGADTVRDLRLNPGCRIEGRVVERGTARPVPGADVVLGTPGRFSRVADVTRTDDQGTFRFTRVEPGAYTLSARRGPLVLTGRSITLAALDRITGLELVVSPAPVVAGRVQSTRGGRIAGALIRLLSEHPPHRAGAARSAADGTFRIEGVLPGDHHLEVQADGHLAARELLAIEPEAPAAEVVVELEAIATTAPAAPEPLPIDWNRRGEKAISGRVVDPEGAALADAALVLARQWYSGLEASRNGPGGVRINADGEGAFTFDGLEEGRYTIWATHPGYADGHLRGVAAGAAGVTVRMAVASSLAGRVVGPGGTPAGDFSVRLLPAASPGETPAQERSRMIDAPFQRVHDPEGRFHFTHVAAGAYEVRVQGFGGMVGVAAVALRSGERRDDLVIRLITGLTIAGRVIDRDGGAPVVGERIAVWNLTRTGRSTVSDGHGAFRVEGLPFDSPVRVLVGIADIQRRRFVPETRRVTVPPGATTLDVGVFRLVRAR